VAAWGYLADRYSLAHALYKCNIFDFWNMGNAKRFGLCRANYNRHNRAS